MKNNFTSIVKLGTSGFSYEDWRNIFYPPEIPRNRMLEFYCLNFPAVEINSSYYRIPSVETIRSMVKKTPEEFEFIFKVHRETTHIRKESEAAMKNLIEALTPAIEAGKFKGLLAQFPFSFKNNEENRRYLIQTQKIAGRLPLFVEFRHKSWNMAQLAAFLENNNIGYVNVDEPQLPGLMPPQALVTTDKGYIRFHGRNARNWWNGDNASRYDYSYNNEELKSWLPNISQVLKKVPKTHIFFNNHPRGQAIHNAREMKTLINDQLHLNI